MRNFRRLPPLLRMADLVGLLFCLAAIVVYIGWIIGWIIASPSLVPHWSLGATRVPFIALNLGMLGLACTFAVGTYSVRFRRLVREPFPLDSWQSQVRTLLLTAALPTCALALAVIIPPTSPTFEIVVPITTIGGLVVASSRLTRTPRTR